MISSQMPVRKCLVHECLVHECPVENDEKSMNLIFITQTSFAIAQIFINKIVLKYE